MDTNPDQGVASPEDRLTAHFASLEEQPTEADPPQAEAPEVDQPETEEVQQDQSTEAEEETEELDLGDIRLALPKSAAEKLKAERLMQADYTKKTQELAEQRKAVEEQQQRLQEAQQFQAVALDKAAEIRAIEHQLAKFDQVDWQTLVATDPQEAMRLDLARRQLQEQHGRARWDMQQLSAQEQQKTAQARQQMLERANEELARDIKGWGPELQRSIAETGKGYGFTDAELQGISDPRMVKVLHEAHLYRQLQKSKALTEKKVLTAKPVTTPAARTATTSAQVQKVQDSMRQLKRTGKAEDAERALLHLFEHKRKR